MAELGVATLGYNPPPNKNSTYIWIKKNETSTNMKFEAKKKKSTNMKFDFDKITKFSPPKFELLYNL